MAWGETHVLTGIAIQQLAEGKWEVGLPMAIISHWPLDDLNVGVASVYHGIGGGWRKVVTSVFRVPLILYIGYLFYRYGFVLHDNWPIICGLAAWLALDHEWIVGWLLGRHGYGLHKGMFPKWLRKEWGLIPWFIVMALLAYLVWS